VILPSSSADPKTCRVHRGTREVDPRSGQSQPPPSDVRQYRRSGTKPSLSNRRQSSWNARAQGTQSDARRERQRTAIVLDGEEEPGSYPARMIGRSQKPTAAVCLSSQISGSGADEIESGSKDISTSLGTSTR